MSDYVFAANAADVVEGGIYATLIDDTPVALTRVNGVVRAFGDICTHDDGPLAEGTILGECVQCPRHGARFDLRTGKQTFPAAGPIPIYASKIEGERILVKL